jgi:hypothetical protein
MNKSEFITVLKIAYMLTKIASAKHADKTQQICYAKPPLNHPNDLPPNAIQGLSPDIILNIILIMFFWKNRR